MYLDVVYQTYVHAHPNATLQQLGDARKACDEIEIEASLFILRYDHETAAAELTVAKIARDLEITVPEVITHAEECRVTFHPKIEVYIRLRRSYS